MAFSERHASYYKHMIAATHSLLESADSSSMQFADHSRDRVVYRAFPLVFIDMKR